MKAKDLSTLKKNSAFDYYQQKYHPSLFISKNPSEPNWINFALCSGGDMRDSINSNTLVSDFLLSSEREPRDG